MSQNGIASKELFSSTVDFFYASSLPIQDAQHWYFQGQLQTSFQIDRFEVSEFTQLLVFQCKWLWVILIFCITCVDIVSRVVTPKATLAGTDRLSNQKET